MIRFQVSLESHHLTWYMLAYMLVCKAAVLFFFLNIIKNITVKNIFGIKDCLVFLLNSSK
jgi:hypothetical protein